MKIGIEGLKMHSIHYTPGIKEECHDLHGHTFIVNVEVEGKIKKEKGMVMDFHELKEITEKIISEYDHAIIVPKKDRTQIKISGPFKKKLKEIPYPYATTEYIALSIANEIAMITGLKTRIRVYEGPGKYAEVVIHENRK